jgi:hypothetical protein
MKTCHRFSLTLTLTLLLSPLAFAADVVIEHSGAASATSIGGTDLGQTFFATNTSGVLSSNVNSSKTTATKSLVQNVLQRIKYNNKIVIITLG